ncbi:MAG: hypothetical protein U1F11_11400 [Steroidobacteraceae bacterium]
MLGRSVRGGGAAVRGLLAAALAAAAQPGDDTLPHAQQVPDRLRIKRVTADADGRSRLDVIELPVVNHDAGRSIVSRLNASDVELGYSAPGGFIDWHRVSTPRLWIILQGSYEFGTGDGRIHRLEAGDIVLAADTTGQGHTSRNVGTLPAFVLTVRLPAVDPLQPQSRAPVVPPPQ